MAAKKKPDPEPGASGEPDFHARGTMRPGETPRPDLASQATMRPGNTPPPADLASQLTLRAGGTGTQADLASQATMRPGATPPVQAPTAESATIRPGADPFAQTGVIPGGRKVDRTAPTLPVPDYPLSPESGTIREEAPSGPRPASGPRRSGPGLVGSGDGPKQLGQYQLVKELGRGGMGVVYKAHHVTLNRDVALKVMLGGPDANEQDTRRFLREAEACAALKHPNIVPVFDISDVNGQYYFAMEFVEGMTLLDWSKREKRSIEAVVTMMRKVCDALAYAHQRGIIHRDLKPHNVMVDKDGEPKVMDFGLAKRLDGAGAKVPGADKTVVGTIMGTPQYMPPEQATGRVDEVDTRSDVYALGVILYELIAGELPIDAQSLQELLFKIENYDPPPLRQRRRDCPWELEVIVSKAMAKEKEQRFQSAAELGADIARYERKEPILARRASVVYRARKFVQRNRTGSAIAVTAVLLVAVMGGLWARAQRARLAKLAATARSEAAAANQELDRAAGEVAGLGAQAGLDRVKKAGEKVEHAKGSIGAALAEGAVGQGLETEENKLDMRYAELSGRQRDRVAAEAALEERRREAAALVVEAKRQRAAVEADVAGDKVKSKEDGEAAKRALDEATEKLLQARGLDEKNADVKAELDAVIRLGGRVGEIVSRETQRGLYLAALEDGQRKLQVARGLAAEREVVEIEDAGPDEVADRFIDASIAFEKARTYDNVSEAAKRGVVDATLEWAAFGVATANDFKSAHLAARKVRDLDPERARRFVEWANRAEASSQKYEELVASARAQRTLGNFRAALAAYEQAIAIDAEDRQNAFGARVCKARVACSEGRHLDELAMIEEAAAMAPTQVERAEADAERGRNARELLDEAQVALDAGRGPEASGIVEKILAYHPDDAGARRLKVELAGRSRALPGFVFVSEGAFRYSLASGKDTAVPAFLIGEAEVTNAQFLKFVAAGGYFEAKLRKHWPEEARALFDQYGFVGRDGTPGPSTWVGGKPLPGTDDLPVAGVSWYEAAAYASWRSEAEGVAYRLPTEVEWEKAAVFDRAAKPHEIGRPWKPAEWERFWSPYFDRIEGPKPVKASFGIGSDGAPLLDKSPCGAYDMYGNVHEWVADRTPDGRAVLRGGSFLSRLPDRSAPTRRFPARPEFRAEIVGFRLATAAPE
ncbi:MAG TPA: protein kinase [Planctomycetota bacterium]|nr:protein kinase [Planctomycetota bacterium]